MSVHITFQTPRRENVDRSSERHSREIPAVPKSVAEQMVEDFNAYEKDPSDSTQTKLYTYPSSNGDPDSAEAIVALDFDEVLVLKAAPTT